MKFYMDFVHKSSYIGTANFDQIFFSVLFCWVLDKK